MKDLIIQNLTKAFDQTLVLKDFSTTFPAGSITSVMGPSGCGKSTLLHILMGILPKDAGEILGVEKNEIAPVFQEERLCETFSAFDNVRIVSHSAVLDKEIKEHLTEVGLQESMYQPVRYLSGGMQRRVAIVRAILAKKKLVLLDEPLRGLDEELRRKIAQYMLKYTKDATVVMVTHHEEEKDLMGGRLLIMKSLTQRQ